MTVAHPGAEAPVGFSYIRHLQSGGRKMDAGVRLASRSTLTDTGLVCNRPQTQCSVYCISSPTDFLEIQHGRLSPEIVSKI